MNVEKQCGELLLRYTAPNGEVIERVCRIDARLLADNRMIENPAVAQGRAVLREIFRDK